jgi:hypothetical protein
MGTAAPNNARRFSQKSTTLYNTQMEKFRGYLLMAVKPPGKRHRRPHQCVSSCGKFQ